MKVKLNNLRLFCRQSEELVLFADQLSFFHGEMSAGKSTIAELIDYCFGGKVVSTPAITSEVVSVSLDLQIESTTLLLHRSLDLKTSVEVTWDTGAERGHEALPLAASNVAIVPPDIHNLSDFLLRRMGLPVIQVRRRTDEAGSDLIRLGFRDLFEFVYLNQSDLDSSFFLLEQPIRAEKSKDALRFFLGFWSDKLNKLEIEATTLRQEQRSKRDAAKRISEFLGKFGFSSEADIDQQIWQLMEDQEKVTTEIEGLQTSRIPLTSISEEEREKVASISNRIEAIGDSISELRKRVEEQESLVAEFISLKFKAARAKSAGELLQGAKFEACPSCGTKLQEDVPHRTCHLCKSELNDGPRLDSQTDVIEQDLSDRIEDLKSSVKTMRKALTSQNVRLEKFAEARSILEAEIRAIEIAQESEYVARVRHSESRLGAIKERIRSLNNVRKMPAEVERMVVEADELSVAIANLERQIAAEVQKLEEGEKNVQLLERNFLQLLLDIGFPGITDRDSVVINRRTWQPSVYIGGAKERAWTFDDAGSGGKKVLFKILFVVALHVTAAMKGLPVPQLLIIDSVMKNIAPDVNEEIFRRFYEKLYELMESILSDWQVILIDQTFAPPPSSMTKSTHRLMTQDDPEHPPLIHYYRGA